MLENSPAFSGFSVDDIAEAQRFYGEVLGVDLIEENGMLKLQHPDGHHTLVYPSTQHEPGSFTVLNFPVADIEATVDELVERGVAFELYEWVDAKGINRQGGPLIAWFKDPAGNILSVLEQS